MGKPIDVNRSTSSFCTIGGRCLPSSVATKRGVGVLAAGGHGSVSLLAAPATIPAFCDGAWTRGHGSDRGVAGVANLAASSWAPIRTRRRASTAHPTMLRSPDPGARVLGLFAHRIRLAVHCHRTWRTAPKCSTGGGGVGKQRAIIDCRELAARARDGGNATPCSSSWGPAGSTGRC